MKTLVQSRIDSQLSMKEAIKRLQIENEGSTQYLLCGRTLNQDLNSGEVVISFLLCKYVSYNEALNIIPKYREIFGDE